MACAPLLDSHLAGPASFLQPTISLLLLHVMAAATPQARSGLRQQSAVRQCGSATFTYLMSEIVLVMMSSSVPKPLFLGAHCIELWFLDM